MAVIHIITGLNDGGAEGVLFRLCLSDKYNNHIVVSMMDGGKYGPLLLENGIKVHCLNMRPNRISLAGLLKLYRIIRKIKPDVVQTWMYHADLIGGIIARLSGINNVVWGVRHGTHLKKDSKYLTILIARINAKLSFIVPKKIIYCAEKAKELHEAMGFNASKGFVIQNGYFTNVIRPAIEDRISFRQELGIDDNVFLIGHVGRYNPQKDHLTLVKSIGNIERKHKLWKVVLVGSNLDGANKTLINLIRKHDLINDFIFLGRRSDIARVMNGFDLHVLSSSSGEAFPNVLAEAMACGTPCVTTNVGDAALIVGDTGWVVSPRDPTSLAYAIVQAYNECNLQTENWNDRKKACRDRVVKNFSIEKMVLGFNNIWFSF